MSAADRYQAVKEVTESIESGGADNIRLVVDAGRARKMARENPDAQKNEREAEEQDVEDVDDDEKQKDEKKREMNGQKRKAKKESEVS